ncbi:hypothetical protein [Microvirga mediterraneensis]|uniref:Uncharacterized protein n=1 Tax=Microvirga mediterraneensis TaxID=2754695 RepID=A0A838BPJ3_9HYPH|nr:hypothetical protein [Microvirga mediterraneensis]MBA1156935.1 hypothetical protein [Microvirga mediterraneensis]
MAKFRITHEGGAYVIDAPDENAAMEALNSLGGSKPAKPEVGALQAGNLGIQQGVTLGFGDEIMAGAMVPAELIKGAITGEDSGKGLDRISDAYSRNLARERGKLEAAREQHPVMTGVGEVAGGLVTGGQLARGGATLMRPGQSLPKMVGAGAVEGAAYGAVGGFGEGEGGLENRLWDAGGGAVAGGAIGGAVPLLARGVGAGVSAVRDRMAASPAQRLLLEDIAAEGVTPAELATRRQALGPEGMLADTSETLRLRAEQLAQSDNPARPGVMEALQGRNARAGDRINSAFDEAAGPRPDVRQTLDDIIARRSSEADPLYRQSLDRPIVWTDRLQQFIDDPIMRRGLAQGVRIQRLEALAEGRPFNPHDYAIVDFDAAGDPIVGQVPNMRTLNVAKKGLDALVEGSRNQFGRLTEEGRALDQVRRSFLSQLDAMNPDYAAARQSWQGNSEVLEAFQRGREIFGSGTHPDFLAAEINDMSEAGREALRLGVRAAADEAMGRVRNGALKGRTLLDSDWNERKILQALGEEDGRALINALTGEQEMAATANQALGNSATSRRMDNPFRKQQKTDDRAGIVKNALNMRFGDAFSRLGEYAGDAYAGRRISNLARDVGPLLTARGAEADNVVQALIDAQTRRSGVQSAAPVLEQRTRDLLFGGARARPLSVMDLGG